jgi:hypothetical protein
MIFNLFRHGARNPFEDFPNMSFNKDRESYSDLTIVGMRQQYNLGKLLKNKYSNLFTNSFKTNQIKVYGSSQPRNAASAFGQVQGIFEDFSKRIINTPHQQELFTPPSASSISHPSNDFATPISLVRIGANDNSHNFMFDSDGQCPDLVESIEEILTENKQTYSSFFDDFYSIWENNGFPANEYSQTTTWDFESASKFSDALLSNLWTKTSSIDRNVLIHTLFFHSFIINMRFSNTTLSGYLNTPLFLEWKSLIENLKNDLENDEHKFEANLFSAHDTNVTFALNSLSKSDNLKCMFDFYNTNMKGKTFSSSTEYNTILSLINESECFINVTFASNIIVEIYHKGTADVEVQNDLAVKVYFNNKELTNLSISLDDFEDILDDAITSSFNSKCGMSDLTKGKGSLTIQIIVIIAFVFTIVMFILVSIMMILLSSQEQKKNEAKEAYTNQESKMELLGEGKTNKVEDDGIKEGQMTKANTSINKENLVDSLEEFNIQVEPQTPIPNQSTIKKIEN